MHNYVWHICGYCQGEGKTCHPEIDGFTSSEWNDLEDEQQENYMKGVYDIPCQHCVGSGKVKIFNEPANEKESVLAENNRIDRELAKAQEAERQMGC